MRIGIIGGGHMGAAIMSRVAQHYKVMVCEKNKRRCQYLKRKMNVCVCDVASLVQKADIIILAVKPQDINSVLKKMATFNLKKKLVISIAAGVTTLFIERQLPSGVKVVRTMPNLPAQIAQGITAVAGGRRVTKQDIRKTSRIFNCVGATVVVEETWRDAMTAVSGSGPAYIFLFVECLIKAAQSLGLSKNLSRFLVEATVLGSAHLLVQQKQDPAVLRANVTSKGGTTQAAINIFEKKNIEQIFRQALTAACKRSQQLARR